MFATITQNINSLLYLVNKIRNKIVISLVTHNRKGCAAVVKSSRVHYRSVCLPSIAANNNTAVLPGNPGQTSNKGTRVSRPVHTTVTAT